MSKLYDDCYEKALDIAAEPAETAARAVAVTVWSRLNLGEPTDADVWDIAESLAGAVAERITETLTRAMEEVERRTAPKHERAGR